MQVTYPSSVPPDSFAQAINIAVHVDHPFRGDARAVHDFVLFELKPTGFFAATCRVELEAGSTRADGAVSFSVGEFDPKYIEFSEFPPAEGPTAEEVIWTTCTYVVTLTNDDQGSGAHIEMTAWSG
jgi:hypothetical protein